MANGAITSQRFNTLLGLGKFISFVGWVIVAIGGILFLIGLGNLGERGLYGGMSAMGLVSGLGVLFSGLLMVATGQVMSCFVAIENNTHESLQAQKTLMNLMTGQAASPEPERTEASSPAPEQTQAPSPEPEQTQASSPTTKTLLSSLDNPESTIGWKAFGTESKKYIGKIASIDADNNTCIVKGDFRDEIPKTFKEVLVLPS